MKKSTDPLWVLALMLCLVAQTFAATGRFVGDVVAKWLPNGRDMELTESITYIDSSQIHWNVPKGAVIDGASIPRPLWSIVGPPFTGKYRKASVIHDYFCQSMARPWQDVHRVFFDASLAEGNTLSNAKLMYAAVYAWGPRWEYLDGKPARTRDSVRNPSEKELIELSEWIIGKDPSLDQINMHIQSRFPRTAPMVEKRVALVIGNAAYQHTATLLNPGKDAKEMADTFKSLGYHVIEGFDLDKAGMDRTIRQFASALGNADAGLFFYAGHGLQVAGQNYLVPIDARLEDASGLDFEMVRLNLIHRTMERESKTNIIFLDACRDNPLARNLARAMGTRSVEIGRGLAVVESGVGTLISFSTQPGNVALDGTGRNSPYSEALSKRIRTLAGSEDLSTLLIGVRNDVMAVTKNKQVPWEHSALRARYFFATPSVVAPPSYDKEIELAFWNAVKDAKSTALLQTYMDRFPNGHFVPVALILLDQLNKEHAAEEVTLQREAEIAAAEQAHKSAAARQEEEKRKVEEAKRADEVARAGDELRAARQAMERAEVKRQEAMRAAAEAKGSADAARAEQERVLKASDGYKTGAVIQDKKGIPAPVATPVLQGTWVGLWTDVRGGPPQYRTLIVIGDDQVLRYQYMGEEAKIASSTVTNKVASFVLVGGNKITVTVLTPERATGLYRRTNGQTATASLTKKRAQRKDDSEVAVPQSGVATTGQ